MNKLDFLNLGKSSDDEFIYNEEDIRDLSWIEVIHKKFRDVIAWLTYDKEWKWIDLVISSLADFEMGIKCLFDKELKEAIDGCDLCIEGKSIAENNIPEKTLYCEDCIYKGRSNVAKFFYGYQESGYCYYLGRGDYSFNRPTMILWDGCKECGINEDIEVDFEEDEVYNMSEDEMWRRYEENNI